MIRKLQGSKLTFSKISARKKVPENSRWPFYGKNPLKMGNYTIFGRFENPRRGKQARNLTTHVPKILDLKSSSEPIFSKNCRWLPLHDVLFTADLPVMSCNKVHFIFVYSLWLILCCFLLAVTAIKFAHDDKYLLACSSTDGTLSVCALVPSPPSVSCTLRGHTAAIMGNIVPYSIAFCWYNFTQ